MLRNHHPRALLWTAIAAVALLSGAAFAQSGATADAQTDAPAKATYQIKATPERLALHAGGHETIRLHARAAQDVGLRIQIGETPPGLVVTPAADAMTTGGEPLGIRVHAAADAAPGERVLVIATTDAAGERQETRVVLHVLASPSFRASAQAGQGPSEGGRPPPSGPQQILRVEPAMQRAKGGETLTYGIVLRSPRNATFDLDLMGTPRGYNATLHPAVVHVAAGERGQATLTVVVPENASAATFAIRAKAREGDLRAMAEARVETAPRPPMRPAQGDADEERYPMARDAPGNRSGLGLRATLYPRDAVVGPEGGRVLFLLRGGERDQFVKLDARVGDGDAWRVHVRDAIRLPAHGQAWAWVVLEPGSPDAAPLRYDLVASGQGGRVALPGTAQVDTERAD